MEKYRVSLEVAKKLKEAGYPQDGCDMHWRVMTHLVNTATNEPVKDLVKVGFEDGKLTKYLAAPCVGRLGEDTGMWGEALLELGDMLDEIWESDDIGRFISEQEKEADARALMWIELKKRELI